MVNLNINIEHFHNLFKKYPNSIIIGKCSENETVGLFANGCFSSPGEKGTYYAVAIVNEDNTFNTVEFIKQWW